MNIFKFFKRKKSKELKPIYRVDVLKLVKKNYRDYSGLCYSIRISLYELSNYNIVPYVNLRYYFPLFRRDNAKMFGADGYVFWWTANDWTTGRMDFLDWLIEQYKDDKTDLRDFIPKTN